MNTYSRQAFRAWLTTLPDVPTDWGASRLRSDTTDNAKSNNCPIAGFMGGYSECYPTAVDRELVSLIDGLSIMEMKSWKRLKPRQIIALIDSLDSEKKKERKGIPAEVLAIFATRQTNPDRVTA